MASKDTPKIMEPVTLNTGPEQGYTHWGQQVFYLLDPIRVKNDLKSSSSEDLPEGSVCGETTTVHLRGKLEMFRTKDNARLYDCRIKHFLEEIDNEDGQTILRSTEPLDNLFSIP